MLVHEMLHAYLFYTNNNANHPEPTAIHHKIGGDSSYGTLYDYMTAYYPLTSEQSQMQTYRKKHYTANQYMDLNKAAQEFVQSIVKGMMQQLQQQKQSNQSKTQP